MKMRRKMALLSSCALIVNTLAAALPTAARADDDGLAGFAYFKLPLGGPTPELNEPKFGFGLTQPINGELMPSPSVFSYGDSIILPPLVDLQLTGAGAEEMPAVSFAGVDGRMLVTGKLNQNGEESPLSTGEWIGAGLGFVAVVLGGCAAAGCFSDDDDDSVAAEGGEGPAVIAE